MTSPSRITAPAASYLRPPAEQARPHFPQSLERTSYGDFRYRHCVHCSAQGRRKKTHYECDTCRQPLCVDPCFREYHAP